MKQLGWSRAENPLRFGNDTARGYVRGDAAETVIVTRDPEQRNLVYVRRGAVTRILEDGVVVERTQTDLFGAVAAAETSF
jgi:hypothetical protein